MLTRRPLSRIIRRHAEDAAFYWTQFFGGTRSSVHDLQSLRRLEDLLCANLEGLRVAQLESAPDDPHQESGEKGWAAAWSRLLEWQTADEAFVVGVLALEGLTQAPGGSSRPRAWLTQLQDAACEQLAEDGTRQIASGLASAAAWLPLEQVKEVLGEWASSGEAALRRCAVAVSALGAETTRDAVARGIADSHPLVRSRALRAVGEIGGAEFAEVLADHVNETSREIDARSRFWAAWSLSMLGRSDGFSTLKSWLYDDPQPPSLQEGAAALGLSAPLQDWQAEFEESVPWVRQRRSLCALRYTGDARQVDVLLARCEHQLQPDAIKAYFSRPQENLARLAADVIAHITGARLSEQELWQQAPAEPDATDEDLDLDPERPAADKQDMDSGLLWPKVETLKAWWRANQSRFKADCRYLAGEALTPAWALRVLASPRATQLQRYHAACYLRHTNTTRGLFNVRARVTKQRAGLSALSV